MPRRPADEPRTCIDHPPRRAQAREVTLTALAFALTVALSPLFAVPQPPGERHGPDPLLTERVWPGLTLKNPVFDTRSLTGTDGPKGALLAAALLGKGDDGLLWAERDPDGQLLVHLLRLRPRPEHFMTTLDAVAIEQLPAADAVEMVALHVQFLAEAKAGSGRAVTPLSERPSLSLRRPAVPESELDDLRAPPIDPLPAEPNLIVPEPPVSPPSVGVAADSVTLRGPDDEGTVGQVSYSQSAAAGQTRLALGPTLVALGGQVLPGIAVTLGQALSETLFARIDGALLLSEGRPHHLEIGGGLGLRFLPTPLRAGLSLGPSLLLPVSPSAESRLAPMNVGLEAKFSAGARLVGCLEICLSPALRAHPAGVDPISTGVSFELGCVFDH